MGWWFEKKKCVSVELQLESQEVSRHGVSQLILTKRLVQYGLGTAHIQGEAQSTNII